MPHRHKILNDPIRSHPIRRHTILNQIYTAVFLATLAAVVWGGAPPTRAGVRSIPVAQPARMPERLDLAAADDSVASLPLVTRIGGPLGAVLLSGRTAYASFDYRLHAFDIADPTHPRELGSGPIDADGRPTLLPGTLLRMAHTPDGDRLFGLVDWDHLPAATLPQQARLVAIDIAPERADVRAGSDALSMHLVADLALPIGIGRPASDGDSEVVALGGGWAAVAGPGVRRFDADGNPADPDRLVLVDLRDPPRAAVTSMFPLTGTVVSLTAHGAWLYAVTRTGEVTGLGETMAHVIAFDIRDPLRPARCGTRDVSAKAVDLTIRGDLGYLVAFDSVHVLDMASPCEPTIVGAKHPVAEFPPQGSTFSRFAYPADIAAWLGADLLVPSHDSLAGYASYLRLAVDAFADFRSVGRMATHWYAGYERPALDGYTAIRQWGDNLAAIDVTEPNAPRQAGALAPLLQPARSGIAADRGRLVLWTDAGKGLSQLTILDPAAAHKNQRVLIGRDTGHYLGEDDTAVLAGRWLAVRQYSGLEFVDLGLPSTPLSDDAAQWPTDRQVTDIAAIGRTIFAAYRLNGQPGTNAIVGLNAGGPVVTEKWQTETVGERIAAEIDRLYATVDFYDPSTSVPAAGILQVFHVDSTGAESTATLPLVHGVAALAADDHRAYILDRDDRVHVYDARDPRRPTRIATIDASLPRDGSWTYPLDAITARRGAVFVAGPGRLVAIDATDAAAPRFLADRRFPEQPRACPPGVICDYGYSPPGLALAGDTLFVNVLDLGILAFDVHAIAPDDGPARRVALPWLAVP